MTLLERVKLSACILCGVVTIRITCSVSALITSLLESRDVKDRAASLAPQAQGPGKAAESQGLN